MRSSDPGGAKGVGEEEGRLSALARQEHEAHRPDVLGLWRQLYVRLVRGLDPQSVLDLGAGSPDLLRSLPEVDRRIAVDAGDRWREGIEAVGAEFHQVDLNERPFPRIGPVDVVVCTDVLEHLLFPEQVLEWIQAVVVKDTGVLLTHVPNEFTLRRMLRIMLGTSDSVYFHPHCEEHEDPHIRRFTDIGFRRFLDRFFEHNIKYSHVHYGRFARLVDSFHLPVPYCLQPGPGYLSTNCPDTASRIDSILTALPRHLRRDGPIA